MARDGYEPFNLDNDFEGGKWVNGEFFYENKKEKRKFNREDAIYGVFGEGSDSEEDSRSAKRSKKDYSAPLSFVSSGKIEPTKASLQEEQQEEKSERSRSEEKEVKGSENKPKKKKKAAPQLSEHELNASYGIGHKLLKGMGWKGGSLKEDRGLAEPIQVKLRPKNQGLSYGDFNERTDQSLRHFEDLTEEQQQEADAMDTEEFLEEQPREQHWKRSAPKRKTVYKTVEEVMGGKAQSAQQVILDMRGPQVKVLSGASQISQRDIITRSNFLPELRSNVALLVDVKEGQIHSIDQRRRHEENVLKGLKREEFNLKQHLELEEGEIQRVEDILTIVNKCQEKLHSKTDQLTLEFIAKIFDLLKNKFVEEWNKYQLESLAYIFVFPLLKQHLGAWEPTKDQQLGPRLVSAWYTLLSDAEEEDDDRRHRRVTPWTRLLADVVLPRLTEWFNREWNVRDAAAGLSLIAAWEDVLPLEARDLVIENSLLPRLRREVERWNPTKDPQPLSQWLVPWRVVLGPRLHELGAVLKPTLLNALTAWHPADQSALALLRPLRPVWDQHAWESLLVRVILPKLSLAMREFIINPQQQVIDGFQWVINWHDLVPPHLFIPIFEFEFFPKWFNVLHLWLSTAPNYEEVMRWYLNWKKMFPEQLQSHERIRDKFNYALELMNAVLSNSPLPPLDVTRIQPPVPIQAPKVEPAVAAPVKRVPLSEALTFREMIERLADDNGLGFVPTKKQHDGKPIYMFGSVPIIVDKDLILTQVGGQWRPSSIEALLKQVQ